MSISASLIAFGVRYVLDVPVQEIFRVIENRITDHGRALPKALAKANDRAWQAVGLALVGEGLIGRIKDVFRDGDLRGIRDQIKKFLDNTPTGLETTNAAIRVKAAEEWHQLRKGKRLSAEAVLPAEVARHATTLERYSDPARLALAAHRVVADTAAALREEAPHLADLLTKAPPNGAPLLAVAFGFFFRRELETDDELARGLTFDFLRQITDRQERGFQELEVSLGAHVGTALDRLDSLFDALGDWFASADAKLGEINAKLDQLIKRRDVPTSTSEPLKVTVTNKGELELIQTLRDLLRSLPPELVAATDWSKLGDTLAAAGLFGEAKKAHEAAVAAAQAAADRTAEAEAEYKRFRDSCETGDRAAAMAALRRAVELDPDRFTPFDLHRYKPEAVVGVGGFGTVFVADDQYVRVGKDRRPQKVAIKAVHDSGWDAILERDLSETFDEADTLSTLNHPGIVKTVNRGFGDPGRRKRPYMVLEYFPGVTLDAWLKTKGPLPVNDVLVIAKQVAEAVHAAHQLGIFHRDIKPANVMVALDEQSRQWQVKVIDFGLAVRLHVAQTSVGVPSDRRAVLDRSLAGTIRYAPPEQRNELDADVGPYSDVYAWGKTCLDLLFGTTEPKSMHWKKLPADYRDRVQELLERATVDDLEHRFSDFGPVLSALARLLGEGSSSAQTAGQLEDMAAAVQTVRDSAPTVSKVDDRPTPRQTPVPAAPPVPTEANSPSAVETPVARLKRIKAEAAAKMEQGRALLQKYAYADAVEVLSSFTPEQAEFRNNDLLREATEKRDRLQKLDRDIQELYRTHKFNDPRLPVLLRQYLALKPDDEEMRELAAELPPPNEPPADPKEGNIYTMSVPIPEPEQAWLIDLQVPIPEPEPALQTTLEWEAVPPNSRINLQWRAASLPAPVELKWQPAPPRPNPNPTR